MVGPVHRRNTAAAATDPNNFAERPTCQTVSPASSNRPYQMIHPDDLPQIERAKRFAAFACGQVCFLFPFLYLLNVHK